MVVRGDGGDGGDGAERGKRGDMTQIFPSIYDRMFAASPRSHECIFAIVP